MKLHGGRLLVVAALMLSANPVLAGPPKKAARPEPPLPTASAAVTESAVDVATQDEPRKVAEAYLKALSGQDSNGGIETLLGGATLTARIYTIENWKVVGREKHKSEVGELADLQAFVASIDKEGRTALATMIGGGPGAVDPDGLDVQEVSADDAKKILEPTRLKASKFAKTHPVFAYIARVDKQVYWHPKNPFRKILADAGAKGKYSAALDLFWIETAEGSHGDALVRKWPLRVVSFKAGKVDTGMKILPASDWNAE